MPRAAVIVLFAGLVGAGAGTPILAGVDWRARPAPAATSGAQARGQAAGAANQWAVSSPDGRNALSISRQQDGQLKWSATRGAAVVIAPSPLGVRRTDQAFVDGLTFVSATAATTVSDDYVTVHGKRRDHHVQARERTLTFANAAGARVQLVLRSHNDGVAFRYRFPETDAAPKTVTEELTGFAVPLNSKAWIEPQQPVGMYAPAYEDLYQTTISGAPAPAADGWALPALFHTPAGPWALISESGMDGSYNGSHLAPASPGGTYRIKFPDPAEGRGTGSVQPQSTLPWTLPWRLVVMADAATGILESDLVDDLSAPSRVADASWIKPGRAAWSWWSDSDSPKHAESLNAFTDFAAEMGWEYSLVDANWNLMQSGTIDDVRAHAREKNMGLLLWYNSGGPHNDVTEAPRGRMFDRDIRRAEMARLARLGREGHQGRFLAERQAGSDAAVSRRDAGRGRVPSHGRTFTDRRFRVAGSASFPNLIGMEAVAGAEQYQVQPGLSRTRAGTEHDPAVHAERRSARWTTRP